MYLKILDQVSPELLSEVAEFDDEGITHYLTDPFTFTIVGVYSEDDRLIGIAAQKVIEEYKIALRAELSKYKKAKIISGLMEVALNYKKSNESVVFITKDSERFVDFLEKKFNFARREGIPLGD